MSSPTGAGAATLRSNDCCALASAASVAVIVTRYGVSDAVPAAGVPLTIPVAGSSASPLGRPVAEYSSVSPASTSSKPVSTANGVIATPSCARRSGSVPTGCGASLTGVIVTFTVPTSVPPLPSDSV
jgi:hypothetical protein